jgi:hypothetical protein
MTRMFVLSTAVLVGLCAVAQGGDKWTVPEPFTLRGDREAYIGRGGSAESQEAVAAALKWLAKVQSKDGRWDSDGWAKKTTAPRDLGDGRYDVGITGLSLLAFLADGQTPKKGVHKDAIARGMAWLLTQQKKDGSLGFSRGETIYNHAFATFALVEGYALTGDAKLKASAQGAVLWCLKAQNPNLGWQYGVKVGRNDTSITTWMLQVLSAADAAGLDAGNAFPGGRRWLKRATNRAGDVGYQTPGGGSAFLPANDGKFDPVPAMSAASLAARLRMGDPAKGVAKTTKVVLGSLPVWGPAGKRVNFYYWYYGTTALQQLNDEGWDKWNDALHKALLPHQETKGAQAGSWPPAGEWCLAGGRIYGTAINALTLSTYTRYK